MKVPSLKKYLTEKNKKIYYKQIIKGRTIYYKKPIRTGTCSRCGYTEKTYLHHTSYKEVHKNPLANTIEVCGKCHWFLDQNNRKKINKSYN